VWKVQQLHVTFLVIQHLRLQALYLSHVPISRQLLARNVSGSIRCSMPGSMLILTSLVQITHYFKQVSSEARRFFDHFSTHNAEQFVVLQCQKLPPFAFSSWYRQHANFCAPVCRCNAWRPSTWSGSIALAGAPCISQWRGSSLGSRCMTTTSCAICT